MIQTRQPPRKFPLSKRPFDMPLTSSERSTRNGQPKRRLPFGPKWLEYYKAVATLRQPLIPRPKDGGMEAEVGQKRKITAQKEPEEWKQTMSLYKRGDVW